MNHIDDTLLKDQYNKENTPEQKGGKNVKKVLGTAAALAASGAAGYAAAENFGEKDDALETAEAQLDETVEVQTEETAEVTKSQEKPVQEPVTEQKQEETHHHHREHHHSHQQEEESRPKVEEPQDDRDHTNGIDVKITSIETQTSEEGNVVHVATGTVEGHQAAFVDDGHGHVQGAIVDMNDNGEVDEGEVLNLSQSGMTMGDLADNLVEADEVHVTPVINDTPEVHVIAVDHDVEMGGGLVDIAAVTINDDPLYLLDIDQNGEVDILVHDDNANGTFEEEEFHAVADNQMFMPTEDDIDNPVLYANNEDVPDYSNDADISNYIV